LAVRLLEGHGYSFEQRWYPFIPPDTPTSFWSLLYPLFVAAVYGVFGVHPLAARLVQALLGGMLLPWMVYRLARRVFSSEGDEGEGLPLIAAAIAAVYLYFVLYAATLMTETFYIVALLGSLEVGLRVGSRLRAGKRVPGGLILQLGLSLGLATLLRQSILPWVPVLFLWLFWSSWRGCKEHSVVFSLWTVVRPVFLATCILATCILPFTIRNTIVYDEFLLLNSNTGYAMYSAQHPMHGTSFREFDAAPLPEDLHGLNEAQMDRELMGRATQFVLDDPVRYLLLSLSRVRAYFEFWPTPDTSLLHNVGRTGSFGLFLPFMLYGLALAVRRLRQNPPDFYLASRILLLAIFTVFYSLLHIFTWAMVRYRLPVDAVLIVFAALAIQDIYVRGRRWLMARGLPG
jgi:hypothetical protein